MSKRIDIILLSMLALSVSATTEATTEIDSLEGACLPKEIEVLVDKVREQTKKANECVKAIHEDKTDNELSLKAMIAFRDFGVALEKTMRQSFMPVCVWVFNNIHTKSEGDYVSCYQLENAWKQLEQLAILQGKSLDDLSSLTSEQQQLAQQAISLYKTAKEKSTLISAHEKALDESFESLKELSEKLTRIDGNDVFLKKADSSALARLADHAFQSSCKTKRYDCPDFINTYLALRKALVKAAQK